MDGDLNRIRGLTDPDSFVSVLDDLMMNELTNDFWSISLPAELGIDELHGVPSNAARFDGRYYQAWIRDVTTGRIAVMG